MKKQGTDSAYNATVKEINIQIIFTYTHDGYLQQETNDINCF